MQVLKSKVFRRFQRKEGIQDTAQCEAVSDAVHHERLRCTARAAHQLLMAWSDTAVVFDVRVPLTTETVTDVAAKLLVGSVTTLTPISVVCAGRATRA